MHQLFLSYRRRAESDSGLAAYLRDEFTAAGCSVFLDVDMPVGARWSAEIDKQIDACDCLIVLLSADTVESEMVLAEVRLAYERQARDGRPLILPVRVDYLGALGYELGAYIRPFNYELWRSPKDNAKVFGRLLSAIRAGHVKAPAPSSAPTKEIRQAAEGPEVLVGRLALSNRSGTLPFGDSLYVRREADAAIERLAEDSGQTLIIKAPAKMGKSSLLIRYLNLRRRLTFER